MTVTLRVRLAILSVSFSALAFAQYTSGRVEGSLLDASLSAVPACRVTLTSLETNVARTVVSSGEGLYSFSAVPPGAYRIAVEKTGFRPVSAELTVSASATIARDFRLEVGDQPIAVSTVADAAPPIDTTEPLRQVTRTAFELASLPNSRRDIVNTIVLAPGVTPTFSPRGGNLTTLSIAQAGQINSNGGRTKATAHQLDYTDANDWEFGGIALGTQSSPDMLQEFQILTNNWNAEYGVKSSAQVVMVTKSGTNALHGAAYDYLQNKALNARDYFDRTGDATPLRQNYFGFDAGAPVWRDHTFVFGSYEGRRTRGAGSTFIANLLTPSARARVTDPNVQSILKLLPLPTAATANPDIGTSAVVAASPSDADLFVVRGDHYLTPSHSVTVRYFQNLGTSYSRTAGSLPGFDATFDPRGRNAMIANAWVVSPSATNELRLSYARSSALFSPETLPATPRFMVTGLAGFGTVQSWPQDASSISTM